MNPKKILDFIEQNKLGFLLGSAVKQICYAAFEREPIVANRDFSPSEKLDYINRLKDAKNYLAIEIRRVQRGQK